MSNLLLQVIALGLALTGVGLWLWQRAKWQDRRQASAMGIDQLLALDKGMPIGDVLAEQAKVRKAAMNRDAKRWLVHGHLLRAGLSPDTRTLVLAGVPPVVLTLAGILSHSFLLGGVLGVVGLFLVFVWVKVRTNKQRQALVHDIPVYLDNVVRMLTVGHSVQSAFQNAPVAPATPLGRAIGHASRLQIGGLDPDQALLAAGELYRADELMLLASILRMSMRFGGRADLVISRVAVFIRDREQAQQELMAQSAETRLSAWILGFLPVAIAAYIMALNPRYLVSMWNDPIGSKLLLTALALQLLGASALYKLAKSLES